MSFFDHLKSTLFGCVRFIGILVFLVSLFFIMRDYSGIQFQHNRILQISRLPKSLHSQPSDLKHKKSHKKIKETNGRDQCLTEHFNDILFVAAFGAMLDYESIPLFEVMYKKVFRNRLYCGPEYMKQTASKSAIFIKQNTRYGAFLYDCLTQVLKNHNNYTGYIFVSESTIVNPKKLATLNKNYIWESNRTELGPTLYGQIPNTSEWWTSPWGMQAIEKLYEYLTEVSYYNIRKTKMTEGRWTPEWDIGQVLNNWLWNGKGEFGTYWSQETFLYLPKRYTSLYLNITKHARPSGVRHEIALPTLVRMIELDSSIQKLSTGVISKSDKFVLDKRDLFEEMMGTNDLVYVTGKRNEKNKILNHLTFKEHGVGEFLKYNDCK
ncbi:uncharacterized protein [Clytia hemisphaerica]|uniref:Uncharacterized protein n=1 Tax=Clytia hemisphaerica TaxID=252671 RepID=A0A7M5XA69_9CNID